MTENKNYRTLVLLLLTLVYAFNFIDRQIIGILSPFIKEDLGLTNTQLGLLKGFMFALFYTIIGLPVAWLADRYNRVRIVAISLAVWSGFTALTGLANNFWQIGLARMGVGIGEAGGSPPSHSIISDLYPKEERAGALSIYALGVPFGIMFAYLAAGQIVTAYGWRMTFVLLGLPGVVLALLLPFIIREPKRGAQEAIGDETIEQVSFRTALNTLLRIPSWWAMCLGIAFASFIGYALATWQIDYLRAFDPDYKFTTIVNWLGVINGTTYVAGTFLGGYIADKFAKKSVSAYGWVSAIAVLVGLPFVLAAFWAPTINLHLIFIAVFLLCLGMYLGPSFAVAQTLAPINMRAMSTALFFLILNLIALGGGPTAVGILADVFLAQHGETHAYRLAITVVCFSLVLSAISFLLAAKFLPKDWEDAKKRNEDLARPQS